MHTTTTCIPCMVYMHSTHTACNHVTRSMVHAHAHVHVHCTRATPLGHMQGLCYSHPHAPPHPVIGSLPLRERHHHPRLRHAVQAGLLRRCAISTFYVQYVYGRTVVSIARMVRIAVPAVLLRRRAPRRGPRRITPHQPFSPTITPTLTPTPALTPTPTPTQSSTRPQPRPQPSPLSRQVPRGEPQLRRRGDAHPAADPAGLLRRAVRLPV